jgi:hypothetical protein
VVAHGSLLDVKEARQLFPEGFRETSISVCCYDRNTGRLYVIAPEGAFLSWDKYGRGTIRTRVVVFELPTLRLIGSVALAEPVYQGPNLLLTPDSQRLLVSYEVVPDEGKHWVFMKEVFDTKGLERVVLKREQVAREPFDPQALAKARFSEKARFAADGKTILDEEYEIVNGQVRHREWPPASEELLVYLKEHPKFHLERLDEAGRRILMWELICEENFAGRYRTRYATGRFALYDALAVKKLREFSVKELEGDYPKIVAISPNSQMMYFAVGNDRLYAVKLTDMTPVGITLSGLSAQDVQCVFADR